MLMESGICSSIILTEPEKQVSENRSSKSQCRGNCCHGDIGRTPLIHGSCPDKKRIVH
jgi:hypothetical protein